jgi:hypothetical protein
VLEGFGEGSLVSAVCPVAACRSSSVFGDCRAPAFAGVRTSPPVELAVPPGGATQPGCPPPMPVVSRSEGMPLDGPGVGPGRVVSEACARAIDELVRSIIPAVKPTIARSRRIVNSSHAAPASRENQRMRRASVPASDADSREGDRGSSKEEVEVSVVARAPPQRLLGVPIQRPMRAR